MRLDSNGDPINPPDDYDKILVDWDQTTDPNHWAKDNPGLKWGYTNDNNRDGDFDDSGENGPVYRNYGSWTYLEGIQLEEEHEYVNRGLYDTRNNEEMDMLYLDMSRLKEVLSGNATADWNQHHDGGSGNSLPALDIDPANGFTPLIYIETPTVSVDADGDGLADREDAVTPASFSNLGIMVINGQSLPQVANPNEDPAEPLDNYLGFTLVTNSPLYIKGNFNADGNIDSSSSYQYEANEVPALIAGDVVTFLSDDWVSSQARITEQTTNNNGDSLYNMLYGTSEVTSLQNLYDMFYNSSDQLIVDSTAYYNAINDDKSVMGNRSIGASPAVEYDAGVRISNKEVSASNSVEISTAVISGVPQSELGELSEGSGGVHNFFRYLEDWNKNSAQIAYRGSILALFEPEVHTAKLASAPSQQLRIYDAPTRIFGYNLLFEKVQPPGTPTGRLFRTRALNYITKAEWEAAKATAISVTKTL